MIAKKSKRQIKDKRVQIYYPRTIPGTKPAQIAKHYVYSKEQYDAGGLWAYVRDLSLEQVYQSFTINIKTTVQFILNYNPKIVKSMTTGLYFEFVPPGQTTPFIYVTQGEPDRYEYGTSDYVFRAEKKTDANVYSATEYEED